MFRLTIEHTYNPHLKKISNALAKNPTVSCHPSKAKRNRIILLYHCFFSGLFVSQYLYSKYTSEIILLNPIKQLNKKSKCIFF